ncbi:MAG: MFS transporter, partial [Actinocatenispora sp.]
MVATDATARTAPRIATLVVVCLALFMALLDSVAISIALPVIRADLNTDVAGLVWIADGYVLVFAALLLTSGTLGDRFGRVGMFRAGLAVFTLGSAVCAAAPTLWVLVAGRVVQGLGAALVTPQTLAILSHTFPGEKERARAFGVWSGVSALALVLGPVIGGALVGTWGWQSMFLVNVPVGIVALILGARTQGGGRAAPAGLSLRHAIDLPGQLLTVLWLGTLTFALIEGSRLGWGAPLIVGLFVVSAAAFVTLLVVERRAPHPMLQLGLFRSATFSASTAVIALVASGMYASFFMISLFLQQVQGYQAAGAGVRFLPAMLTVMVASPLAGLLAGRVGARVPVVLGCLLIGVSLLMLARVDAEAAYGGWWPWLVAFGAGIGLVIPPVNSALMGSVPPERAGLASATGESGQQVGALVGIAVLGALVSSEFSRVVADGAARAGLSAADTEKLARTLFSQSGRSIGGGTRVKNLVAHALTGGVHTALLAAGIAALVAGVVGLAIRE